PAAILLVADVLEGSGKRPQAIAWLEKSQTANPSGAVLLRLAQLHFMNKDSKKAVALLEGWSKESPGDVSMGMQLAVLYASTKNYSAAQAQYEKLAVERPDDPNILNDLAWRYAQSKDSRARATAEKAYALAPGRGDIADTLGSIYASQGDTANAMKYLQV